MDKVAGQYQCVLNGEMSICGLPMTAEMHLAAYQVFTTYLDMRNFDYADYDLTKELDYDEWLPKFSLAYDLFADVMGYVTASKGYSSMISPPHSGTRTTPPWCKTTTRETTFPIHRVSSVAWGSSTVFKILFENPV